MEIEFYDKNTIDNKKLLYAIVVSRYRGKWIFVKHKERDSWEIPAGHREVNENIIHTAERELFEETGAKNYKLEYISDYSLKINGEKSYAALFYAEIYSLGKLPDFEIGEVKEFENIPDNLTYANTPHSLITKVKDEIK